jgi:hypothetical protein
VLWVPSNDGSAAPGMCVMTRDGTPTVHNATRLGPEDAETVTRGWVCKALMDFFQFTFKAFVAAVTEVALFLSFPLPQPTFHVNLLLTDAGCSRPMHCSCHASFVPTPTSLSILCVTGAHSPSNSQSHLEVHYVFRHLPIP